MTPDEASKKWCPFASSRVVTVPTLTGPPTVAVFGAQPSVNCVADSCAVWVWLDTENDAPVDGQCGLVR